MTIINRFYSADRLADGRDRWLEPDRDALRLALPAPDVRERGRARHPAPGRPDESPVSGSFRRPEARRLVV